MSSTVNFMKLALIILTKELNVICVTCDICET